MKTCILFRTAKNMALLLTFGIALASCATNSDVYAKLDANVAKSDYAAAVAEIDKAQAIPEGKDKPAKPIYPEKDLVLLYLDRGVLQHYAGNYEESAKDLEEAERLIQEAYTKSVSQEIASYLANDNTKDYAGETYEDLYSNVFSALDYYHKGDTEGAGVEVRKISEKLAVLEGTEEGGFKIADLMTFFAEAVKTAEATGLTLGINLPVPSPVHDLTVNAGDPGAEFMTWVQSDSGQKVTSSALASYLSAIFYRGEGNADDARIELEKITGFDVSGESDIPAEQARLNFIGFAGSQPQKLMYKQTIPLDCFPTIKDTAQKALALDPTLGVGWAALPVLVPRASSIQAVKVSVNGQTLDLGLLENIGDVMRSTLAEKFDNIYYKAYIQAAVRYIAVEVAGKTALENAKAPNQALVDAAVKAAIVGAKKSADLLAQADTRSSRYFPDKAFAGGINLAPGEYDVTFIFSNGQTVTKKVKAEAGKANIVEAFNLQ